MSWKIAIKALNLPSQDVWKFTPVSYKSSSLWGRCPALTPLLQVIAPSGASGTADHAQSLDDLLSLYFSFNPARSPKTKDPAGVFPRFVVARRNKEDGITSPLGMENYGNEIVASSSRWQCTTSGTITLAIPV